MLLKLTGPNSLPVAGYRISKMGGRKNGREKYVYGRALLLGLGLIRQIVLERLLHLLEDAEDLARARVVAVVARLGGIDQSRDLRGQGLEDVAVLLQLIAQHGADLRERF